MLPLRDVGREARRRCAARNLHHMTDRPVQVVWLHVTPPKDPSQFSTEVTVQVRDDEGDTIVEVEGAVAVANAIAFAALELNANEVVVGLLDKGTPVQNSLMYLLLGEGEVGYAVRAIFARMRDDEVEKQMQHRRVFDTERDRLEQNMLRDAVILSPAERQARLAAMFEKEQADFAAHLATERQLPRLILYD